MDEPTARVPLVRTEGGQRLDIPHRFRLRGDEVILRADGDRLIIEPLAGPRLLSVLSTFDDLDEAWPDVADPLPEDVRL